MSTLELVIILNVVDTAYVSPEVASLGELHGAETAGVGFLTSVLQTVALHTLLLSESSAALLAFIRPDTCVNALMSSNLRRLQEFLAAVFAAQFEIFSSQHFGSLSYQFQTGLQLLVS